DSGVTLSALPIFQPAQRVWLKQNVCAALRTDRACLSFVVRGFIATPSMVCAGSSYSTYANRRKDHRTLPLNRSAHPGCRTHRVSGLSEVDAQLNIGHGDSGRSPKNHLDSLLEPALSPRRRLATIDHPATSLGTAVRDRDPIDPVLLLWSEL